ncbi:sulfite exporter TauE/SafE family protein [Pseudooceanicola aestuarii]|uniref:sulfite exporter TauE/SafE family protein n=1 Tax=Pseudooceanicola aestuarii TaxID=2697319 RepID=UPI0013D38C0C|nr:sulfite exporter TauE/SafE family protein [Pseudooceanicola aestuarii]
MDSILPGLSPAAFALCLLIGLVAGVIKGMVGFAMPMIMISGLGSIVGPEWALAGLVIPTLLTNGWQALRQGMGEAWSSVKRFRVFLLVGLVALLISAQLVRVLSAEAILLMIGLPIVIFAITQLIGLPLKLSGAPSLKVEVGVASFAGFIGGFSGVWGPPTVAYLTALDTPKADQVRVQGVIYGLGAVALFFAHVGSGVIRWETLPFSLSLVPVALIGMTIGFAVQDRIDQAAFRRATLAVLLIAGGNLVRRGLGL